MYVLRQQESLCCTGSEPSLPISGYISAQAAKTLLLKLGLQNLGTSDLGASSSKLLLTYAEFVELVGIKWRHSNSVSTLEIAAVS